MGVTTKWLSLAINGEWISTAENPAVSAPYGRFAAQGDKLSIHGHSPGNTGE